MSQVDYKTVELPSGAKLYVHEAKPCNGMAVVACPGGGFRQVNVDKEGHLLAPWFNEQGITLAVLDYRMPAGQPELPRQDMREALATIRVLDGVRKVGAMGMSIGGYYAAAASTFLDLKERPDFQILLYSMVSLTDELTLVPLREKIVATGVTEADAEKYSPEKHVDEYSPTAFIATCEDDPAVNPLNSTTYFSALKKAGVKAELHIYPYGKHGFATAEDFPFRTELLTAVGRFISELPE